MSNLADKIEVATAARDEGGDAGSALTIFEMVARQQEAVDKALPAGMAADRFVRMMLTEMRRTPKLAQCDPSTLLGAMMLSAQTGLEPGGPLGHSFIIPRWSSKRKVLEAQFQLGYKGIVQLAGRSGIAVEAHTVRTPDLFEWEYGTGAFLRHKMALDSGAESIAWWAMGRFTDNREPLFVVIDRNVTERARSAGKAGDYGPWTTDYNAMAEKTAALRLAKWLPLTTEVQLAMATDGAVVSGPDVTVEAAAEAAQEQLPAPDESEPDAEPEAPEAES